MKILLHLPEVRARRGGATESMWLLCRAMLERGHEVRALQDRGRDRTVDGIPIITGHHRRLYGWADVVWVNRAALSDRLDRAKTVLWVHSVAGPKQGAGWGPPIPNHTHPHPTAVAWSTAAQRDFARQSLGWEWDGPESVVHPIVHPENYRVEPGERITLVNLMPEKGAELFWNLARAMPDHRFLAVIGGWAWKRQVVPTSELPNVEILPFQPDPREVYRRTRVLLYPGSPDDGYLHGVARVAVEGAASGVPTIAAECPGIRESLGDAAMYVERGDRWDAAIRDLDAPDAYAAASTRARAASDRYPSRDELTTRTEAWMEELCR